MIGVVSGIFEGLYFLSLSKALRDSSLGQSYAIMRGGAMILVWLFSTLFLQERAAGIQYLGAILIFSGIGAMNFKDFFNSSLKKFFKRKYVGLLKRNFYCRLSSLLSSRSG